MTKENNAIDRGLIEKILEADCEDPLAIRTSCFRRRFPAALIAAIF